MRADECLERLLAGMWLLVLSDNDEVHDLVVTT